MILAAGHRRLAEGILGPWGEEDVNASITDKLKLYWPVSSQLYRA
jgi:hypothetical protein